VSWTQFDITTGADCRLRTDVLLTGELSVLDVKCRMN